MASTDPYNEFKLEIELNLRSLLESNRTYIRLLKSNGGNGNDGNEELSYALSELKANLNSLELDLEELLQIISSIEQDTNLARKLSLSSIQVKDRRNFFDRVSREVKTIRDSLASTSNTSDPRKRLSSNSNSYKPRTDDYNSDDEDENPEEEFEMQHQSILIKQQDTTLTSISGTVELLREQARVMGREVLDQNAMLEDLDSHLDSTTARLSKAQRKMEKFVKANSSSPASWCIFLLIIVLSVLLVFILFF